MSGKTPKGTLYSTEPVYQAECVSVSRRFFSTCYWMVKAVRHVSPSGGRWHPTLTVFSWADVIWLLNKSWLQLQEILDIKLWSPMVRGYTLFCPVLDFCQDLVLNNYAQDMKLGDFFTCWIFFLHFNFLHRSGFSFWNNGAILCEISGHSKTLRYLWLCLESLWHFFFISN